jgi:hypothetical protein
VSGSAELCCISIFEFDREQFSIFEFDREQFLEGLPQVMNEND